MTSECPFDHGLERAIAECAFLREVGSDEREIVVADAFPQPGQVGGCACVGVVVQAEVAGVGHDEVVAVPVEVGMDA